MGHRGWPRTVGWTGSGGGGPWSGWFPLGGNFLSGISIAGSVLRDGLLWHRPGQCSLGHYSVDNDFQGSGWFSLGGLDSEPSSAGVTASSYHQDLRRIDISVLDGYYGLPQLIQYPR